MATFVLEIGSEELPARFLPGEEAELESLMSAALDKAALAYGKLSVMTTPRRAVIVLEELDPVQQEREELVIGPPARVAYGPDGTPTKALESFARANGQEVAEAFLTKTEKGDYVAVRKRQGGAKAKDLLAEICPGIIQSLPFAKRMRWGAHSLAYARPLRWILALLDDEVVPFRLEHLTSGRETFGHRIHGEGPHSIHHAKDYLVQAEKNGGIVVDPAQRRQMIIKGGNELAKAIGGNIVWKDSLLDEVQGLVEHPVALLADFDPAYLEVPAEVLLTSMESHQKSFGLKGPDGALLPHFLTVLNITPRDMATVKRGWERVLRARLEDARFFWRTDSRESFDAWLEKLNHVIFIGPLGSMGEKTHRLESLCRWLAERVPGADPELAARAGRLSKADLVSGMVGEFDSLQGIMGGIYAAQKGEAPEVAAALKEQYLPAGPDSPVPQSILGAILSLADKADTLAGCFGLNMIPTGAADPNGLRRCALGIIRILLAFDLNLDVRQLFAKARELYGERRWKLSPELALEKLMEFFRARLRQYFLSQGHDTILADAALGAGADRVPACAARLDALTAFVRDAKNQASLLAFKRVDNILRKQGAKEDIPSEWDAELLRDQAEQTLGASLAKTLPEVDLLLAKGDMTGALQLLATLGPVVDAFFEGVMVMADDAALRRNRLALLRALGTRVASIADIAALQI